MFRLSLYRWSAVFLPLVLTSALQAQSLSNPSFEADGAFTVTPGYATNNGGGITGWTLSDSARIGINGTNGPFCNNGLIPAGTQVAFLQSTGGTSTISNIITGLIPGATYRVSFRANSRAGYNQPNPTWSLNGGPFVGFTAWPAVNAPDTRTASFYQNVGFFQASGATASLLIRNQTAQDSAVLVDDFRVESSSFPTPSVVTIAASGMSNTVVTLNGTVNARGLPTAAWFEWGLFAANNTNATAPIAIGANAGDVSVSSPVSGLVPGTIYHGRIVASNSVGVARGRDVLFGSPVIALNGVGSLTNECHTAFIFTDPGASVVRAPLLSIAGGSSHALALRSAGTVAAWGRIDNGRTSIPPGLNNVVAIAAGNAHNLALKTDGSIVGWGLNDFGVASIPAGLSNVVTVAAGGSHSLALRRDGSVVAWGSNLTGQTNTPADLRDVTAIAAGGFHSLALKTDGTVVAWGNNGDGQSTIPAGWSNIVSIAAGDNHSVALRSDGSVAVLGSSFQMNIPAGLSNVVAIAAGGSHSLALRGNGTVAAWGLNDSGQSSVPVGLSNVVAITAGGSYNLALKSDGSVVAWGRNDYGQGNVPVGVNSSLAVSISGNVNTNLPGSYPFTYTASNILGGTDRVIRTVVVADTIAPVVSLLGINPLLITNLSNLPIIDPGTTSFDDCSQGSYPVTAHSAVNVNFPGTYSITYYSTDSSGNTGAAIRTVIVSLPPAVPGDVDGDGIVSQTELNGVYANYATNSPWLSLTNVAGLGTTNVTFTLSNSIPESYTVEYSTDLVEWLPLGPAIPRFDFIDSNAPSALRRYYRLVLP